MGIFLESDIKKALFKLSKSQKEMLLKINKKYEYDFNSISKAWGLRWNSKVILFDMRKRDKRKLSNNQLSSISRSLKRLEERGLIERKNSITEGSNRTTNVKLTELGIEVIKRLTKIQM